MEHELPIDPWYEWVQAVYLTDFDNDNDIDLLVTQNTDFYGCAITWYENINGTGTDWLIHMVDDTADGSCCILGTDLNNDGQEDILAGMNIDWNLKWWEQEFGFNENGTLISSILDTQTTPIWGEISWTGIEPTNTEISCKVRSSNDYLNMGPWSTSIHNPGSLQGILTDNQTYAQYMIILETTDSLVSPVVEDIAISWNLTSYDQLDISQPIFDRGFPIRHAVDGDWAGAQSFIPTLNTLTKTEIYLRKFGNPEFDLTVELRTNAPQETLIDTITFTPAEVSTSWIWLEVDFEDETINPGTDYFIVCPPAPSGVTTSFGYEWGYSFGNQYNDGAFWFTRDGGVLWRDLPTMYEFSFRLYGC